MCLDGARRRGTPPVLLLHDMPPHVRLRAAGVGVARAGWQVLVLLVVRPPAP